MKDIINYKNQQDLIRTHCKSRESQGSKGTSKTYKNQQYLIRTRWTSKESQDSYGKQEMPRINALIRTRLEIKRIIRFKRKIKNDKNQQALIRTRGKAKESQDS